jgi:hypothetical protein
LRASEEEIKIGRHSFDGAIPQGWILNSGAPDTTTPTHLLQMSRNLTWHPDQITNYLVRVCARENDVGCSEQTGSLSQIWRRMAWGLIAEFRSAGKL